MPIHLHVVWLLSCYESEGLQMAEQGLEYLPSNTLQETFADPCPGTRGEVDYLFIKPFLLGSKSESSFFP